MSQPKQVFPGEGIGTGIRHRLRAAAMSRAVELEALTTGAPPVARDLAASVSTVLDEAKRRLVRPRHGDAPDGSGMLDAVRAIDTAEFRLLGDAPAEVVGETVPRIVQMAEEYLPSGDPARRNLEPLIAARYAGLGSDREIRSAAAAALVAVNNQRLASMRGAWRASRRLTVAAALTGLLASAVALTGVAQPDLLALCFSPPGGQICPGGAAPGPWDSVLVLAAGMAGAVLSSVPSLGHLRRRHLPGGAVALVAAVKAWSGGLLAVVVIGFIAAGWLPGLTALDDAGQILLWSFAAGAAQQLVTVRLDRRLVVHADRPRLWSTNVLRPRHGADVVSPGPDPGGIARGNQRAGRVVATAALVLINMTSAAVVASDVTGRAVPTGFVIAALVVLLVTVASVTYVLIRRRRQPAAAPAPDPDWRADLRVSLEELGFVVTPNPRVGLPDVDSLLQRVDLVAEHPTRTLTVQIHQPEPGRSSADWRTASELVLATGALKNVAGHGVIEPMLVLIDSTADVSLRRLAEERSIELVEVRRGSESAASRLRDSLPPLIAARPTMAAPGG